MIHYDEQGDAWLNGCAFLFSEKQFIEKELMGELLKEPLLLRPEEMQIKRGNVITKSTNFEPTQFPYDTHTNNFRRPHTGS